MNITDWSEYRPDKFDFVGGWVRNWFSNFVESPIEVDGKLYRSVENYYQAMKSTDKEFHKKIAAVTPGEAKRMGRKLTGIRPDWDQIKYNIMVEGLLAKFRQPDWKSRLLATGDTKIIEWNNWNDKIWGVSIKDNLGRNLLGIALMEIRDALKPDYYTNHL